MLINHFLSPLVTATNTVVILSRNATCNNHTCVSLYNQLKCSFNNILFSDPNACIRYWTDGYRKVDFAQEFYWEHSDEQIKFLPWWSGPINETGRNWLRLRRDAGDDKRSWGLDIAFYDAISPTCYICEIDLPIN